MCELAEEGPYDVLGRRVSETDQARGWALVIG